MSGNPLRVNLYVYPSVINVRLMNPSLIENQSKIVAANIKASRLFRSFYVSPRLLEHYNIQYSEKQVKRIDENFYDYSLGTRFRLRVPPQNPPKRLRYLIQKYFSGDVSGDIGEALFSYFLIEEMNVKPYCIGHTRPEKRRHFLTPDFVVWDISFDLADLLNKQNYPLPILGEVKGFTGNVDWPRISHALSQLGTLIANTSLIGLAFLAARNESRQGYDAYIVRVEA